ncbi:MAG: DUF4403 family protein [Polyangia bacterium]
MNVRRTLIRSSLVLASLSALYSAACTEALYPPRPAQLPGPALADPPTSRINMHLSLTESGIKQLIEATVPAGGEVPFSFLGQRKLVWKRTPAELRFNNAGGSLGIKATIQAEAQLPGASPTFTINLYAEAQPALASDYVALLQAPTVQISSDDRLLRAAEWSAGVLSSLKDQVETKLRELRIDLRPVLQASYLKLAQPVSFPVGTAKGCFRLGLQSIEAGPLVIAGGLEKDLSVQVAPSVTLPCTNEIGAAVGAQSLPPLHNVASVPTGASDVIVPIAATYEELQKAMSQAFTNGKLFFDPDMPDLYLEKPEIYASGGEVVTKVHLNGFVKKGLTLSIAGDLYMHGHPQVNDNHIEIPDLEPTIETKNALLKLKATIDGDKMRRKIREALRLDIGARLQSVRQKLANDTTVKQKVNNGPEGCVRADVGRVEVSGIFAHDAYLRLYVKANIRTAAYLPCP